MSAIVWRCAERVGGSVVVGIRPRLRSSICAIRRSSSVAGDAVSDHYVPLSNRQVISICGPDTTKYTQSLITNDILTLSATRRCLWAAVLNTLGRVLCDVFVHLPREQLSLVGDEATPIQLLLDCDMEAVEPLLAHMKKYKVRIKADVRKLEGLGVYSIHGSDEFLNAWEGLRHGTASSIVALALDPRLSRLGVRAIASDDLAGTPVASLPRQSVSCYNRLRHTLGVPEGAAEIPMASAFPLENNMDYLHGVSFDKGCYIGQELTARTKFVGVTRKRIMPVEFSPPLSPEAIPQLGTDITVNGKSVGKFRGGDGPVGIALMRLGRLADNMTMATADGGQVTVKANVPDWWPVDSPMLQDQQPQ